MATYRVTIHEHIIYDHIIEAPTKEDAIELAENSIIDDERHLWREDRNAGWTEIGEVELYDDDDDVS